MAKKNNDDRAKREKNTFGVDEIPEWISNDSIDELSKTRNKDLLRFYIINTPDAARSARGKKIADYENIDESELLESIKQGFSKWEASGNGVIVEERLKKANLKDFPPAADFSERVCFGFNKQNELTCFFGHIRNALAHGRFNIGGSEKILYW